MFQKHVTALGADIEDVERQRLNLCELRQMPDSRTQLLACKAAGSYAACEGNAVAVEVIALRRVYCW